MKTWEARHPGVRQRFTSRITGFRPPTWFQDSMVRGAFRSFAHDHHFEPQPNGSTVMRDVVEFRAPRGLLGTIVDSLFLKAYLTRLISDRQQAIEAAAERRAEARPESEQKKAPPFGGAFKRGD